MKQIELLIKTGMFLFLICAAWQDGKNRRILADTLLMAGVLGVFMQSLRILIGTMEGERISVLVGEQLLSLLPGLGLLGFSAVTGEKIGKGDGWFFLISGLYLDWRKNLLFLMGTMAFVFLAACILLIKRRIQGKAGDSRLPLLVYAIPAGLGVIFR